MWDGSRSASKLERPESSKYLLFIATIEMCVVGCARRRGDDRAEMYRTGPRDYSSLFFWLGRPKRIWKLILDNPPPSDRHWRVFPRTSRHLAYIFFLFAGLTVSVFRKIGSLYPRADGTMPDEDPFVQEILSCTLRLSEGDHNDSRPIEHLTFCRG